MPSTDTVVLIHGLWLSPSSWEHWAERYAQRGITVLTPGWPGFDRPVEELRRQPVTDLGIAEIVRHYETVIQTLDAPPILMGHSFGGLFVQLLLDRGLGAAGVSIAGAPPKGVLRLPPSTVRAALPVLRNPWNRHGATMLTPKQFHHAFTHTLTVEQSQAVYDRHAVPAVNRVLFQGALANLAPHSPARLNWANPHRAPLLLVAGGADRVIPPAVTRDVAKRHRRSSAGTDLVELPGRSHHIVGQDGWEAVADRALDWAIEQTAGEPAA